MPPARRGAGATPASLGLLPLTSLDGACLRGSGRRAVCGHDGWRARKPGSAVSGVGPRSALRRECGEGDSRSGAGICDGRAFPASAAVVLVTAALGLEPFAVAVRRHSRTLAHGAAMSLGPD